jgi:hypothetical protein
VGNRTLDLGFDQLMRTTDAGRAFIDEIAKVMAVDAVGASLEYQRQFAQATVARAPHLSAIASGTCRYRSHARCPARRRNERWRERRRAGLDDDRCTAAHH